MSLLLGDLRNLIRELPVPGRDSEALSSGRPREVRGSVAGGSTDDCDGSTGLDDPDVTPP